MKINLFPKCIKCLLPSPLLIEILLGKTALGRFITRWLFGKFIYRLRYGDKPYELKHRCRFCGYKQDGSVLQDLARIIFFLIIFGVLSSPIIYLLFL